MGKIHEQTIHTKNINIHIKMPPKDKKYQNYEKLLKLLQKFKLKH